MRQGHILRLALGRSADLPPDWPVLEDLDIYRRGSETREHPAYEAASPYYVYSGPPQFLHRQCYDTRGRPFNPVSRHSDNEHVGAQNEVQNIAIDHMSSPEPESSEPIPREVLKRHYRIVEAEQKLRNALEEFCFEMRHFAFHWLTAAAARWSMRGMRSSFTELICADIRREGVLRFLTPGLLPTYLHAPVFSALETWAARMVDKVKDTSFPSMERYIRGATVIYLLQAGVEIWYLTPLRIWAELHCLFLLPAEPWLPPAQFWNPFSPMSPFQPLRLDYSLLYHPVVVEALLTRLFPYIHGIYHDLCDQLEDTLQTWVNDLDEQEQELTDQRRSLGALNEPLSTELATPDAAASQSMALLDNEMDDVVFEKNFVEPLLRGVRRLSAWFGQPSSWIPLNQNRLSPLHNVPVEAANHVWREMFYDGLTIVFYLLAERYSAQYFVSGRMAPALREDAVRRGVVMPVVPSYRELLISGWRGHVFIAKQVVLTLTLKTAIGVAWTGMQVFLARYYAKRRPETTKESLRFFKRHGFGL